MRQRLWNFGDFWGMWHSVKTWAQNPHHPRCSQLLPQWQTAEIRCNRPSKKAASSVCVGCVFFWKIGTHTKLMRRKRLKLDTQEWNSTPRCKQHGFHVQFLNSQQNDHEKKTTYVTKHLLSSRKGVKICHDITYSVSLCLNLFVSLRTFQLLYFAIMTTPHVGNVSVQANKGAAHVGTQHDRRPETLTWTNACSASNMSGSVP